ncbi:Flagellar protein FlgJ [peptidoglycan hydrolase] [hydrothermal vent metagenome]|uniref:Flagellar protein FlgJ [peptidoglycan hydrolase] n=1 Tax=hydrothermal vent metagenome TaxID=652676 RepID=A0A3B0WST7_9ZZZZ
MYTDFNALARLKAEAADQSDANKSKETTKKVASQIEAMFFQMVLKSMREAQSVGDSAESDQTRFYQDMFDKQITQEIAHNSIASGNGLAAMIEKQLSGTVNENNEIMQPEGAVNNLQLIRNQINRSLLIQTERSGNKE